MFGETYYYYKVEWLKGHRACKAIRVEEQNTSIQDDGTKVVIIGRFKNEDEAIRYAQNYDNPPDLGVSVSEEIQAQESIGG